MGTEIYRAEDCPSIGSSKSSRAQSKYPTVAQLVELFKQSEFHAMSYQLQVSFVYALKPFAIFAGQYKLTSALVKRFWASTLKSGLQQNTLSGRRNYLLKFLKWCYKKNHTQTNLCAVLPYGIAYKPASYNRVSHDTYERIKLAMMGTVWYGAVVMSFRTGLKCGEVCRLTWAHVNQRERTIIVAPDADVCYTPGGDLDNLLRSMWVAKVNEYVFPELAMRYFRHHQKPDSFSVSSAFYYMMKMRGLHQYSWSDIAKSYDRSTKIQVRPANNQRGEEGLIGTGTGG